MKSFLFILIYSIINFVALFLIYKIGKTNFNVLLIACISVIIAHLEYINYKLEKK